MSGQNQGLQSKIGGILRSLLPKAPASQPPLWSISPEGKFLYKGMAYYSWGWTRASLEETLGRMRRQIAESSHDIRIEALQIEPGIAKDLLDEGVITFPDLANATIIDLKTSNGTRYDQRIVLTILFNGEPLQIHIQPSMYHIGYQFLVSNHPNGDKIMRDVPDVMTLLSGEDVR